MGITIPPRTEIRFRPIPISKATGGVEFDEQIDITSYKCIDCGLETENVDEMLVHQGFSQHTLWQRIKRALAP